MMEQQQFDAIKASVDVHIRGMASYVDIDDVRKALRQLGIDELAGVFDALDSVAMMFEEHTREFKDTRRHAADLFVAGVVVFYKVLGPGLVSEGPLLEGTGAWGGSRLGHVS